MQEHKGVNSVNLPERYNYIGVFLTLACTLRCDYCLNRFGAPPASTGRLLSAGQWIEGLNRLASRPDLPVTLQGGEPTLHPGFYELVNGIRPGLPVDLLTNLEFDVDEFMARIPPGRLSRPSPYASIRVSYHPGVMDLETTCAKVSRMLKRGYSAGVWAVDHPGSPGALADARRRFTAAGIDFRVKEFLGRHNGRLHGTYTYREALTGVAGSPVECRTSELLIGPDGSVFRCHHDLYAGQAPVGSILDPGFRIVDAFRPCDSFGLCHPCDVKLKTNRFQEGGHTSVEIRPGGTRR